MNLFQPFQQSSHQKTKIQNIESNIWKEIHRVWLTSQLTILSFECLIDWMSFVIIYDSSSVVGVLDNSTSRDWDLNNKTLGNEQANKTKTVEKWQLKISFNQPHFQAGFNLFIAISHLNGLTLCSVTLLNVYSFLMLLIA